MNVMNGCRRGWWILVGWLILAGTVSAGEDAEAVSVDVARAVRGLLELGWQSSADARREIDHFYSAIPPATRLDHRVSYAYALALIKLRRDSDALPVVADVAAADDPHLGVLRTHLWLTMLTRRYDAALIQMEQIAEVLDERAEVLPPTESAETAQRLGTLFGFLEGPAEGSLPPTRLDTHWARILAALPPPLEDAFVEGRMAIRQEHAQLVGQRIQVEQEAEGEVETQRQRLLETARAEREQIEVRRRQLTDQLDQLHIERQSELDALRASERPLVERLTLMVRELRLDDNDLAHTLIELDRLEELLRLTGDPRRRQELLVAIDRLERSARRIRRRRDDSHLQAAGLESQLRAVRQQLESAQTRYNRDVTRLENELAQLSRRDSQMGGMEQRARNLRVERGRPRALSVRASALTTYATFPLEEERKRLIESL
jgi:hypothetical protein